MARWRYVVSRATSWIMRHTRFHLVPMHTLTYRIGRGRILGRFFGTDLLLVTTRGRRTGQRRTTPLAFVPSDEGYVVGNGAAGMRTEPDWFRNLVADPRCEIELRGRRFAARAEIMTGADAQRYAARFLAVRPDTARYSRLAGRPIRYALLRPVADGDPSA